jgi:hypothetical protein
VDQFTSEYENLTPAQQKQTKARAITDLANSNPDQAAAVQKALSGDEAARASLIDAATAIPGGSALLTSVFGDLPRVGPVRETASKGPVLSADSTSSSFVGALLWSIGRTTPSLSGTASLVRAALTKKVPT